MKSLPKVLRPLLVMTAGSMEELSVNGAVLKLDAEEFEDISGAASDVAMLLVHRYWMSLLVSLASVLHFSTLLHVPALPVRWGRKCISRSLGGINFVLKRTANFFTMCTMDEEYIRRKREQLGKKTEHRRGFRANLFQATGHMRESSRALGDVVRQPLAGAQAGGCGGFFAGIGRGLVGAPAKLIVEVGLTTRSLVQAVQSKVRPETRERLMVTRRRPPRRMHGSGATREHSEPTYAALEVDFSESRPRRQHEGGLLDRTP